MGNRTSSTKQVKCVGITVLLFDLDSFYEPKWILKIYIEEPNCEKSIPSTPLRQMYKLRQIIRYIYSQAEKDMELDHKDHTLT